MRGSRWSRDLSGPEAWSRRGRIERDAGGMDREEGGGQVFQSSRKAARFSDVRLP
jgi:hypothetical protein